MTKRKSDINSNLLRELQSAPSNEDVLRQLRRNEKERYFITTAMINAGLDKFHIFDSPRFGRERIVCEIFKAMIDEYQKPAERRLSNLDVCNKDAITMFNPPR